MRFSLRFRGLPAEIWSGGASVGMGGESWGWILRMDLLHNDLGQAIGFPVSNWMPRALPPRTPMEGRFCRLEVLDPERHAADLYDANATDTESRMWTYLGYGPFANYADYRTWA